MTRPETVPATYAPIKSITKNQRAIYRAIIAFAFLLPALIGIGVAVSHAQMPSTTSSESSQTPSEMLLSIGRLYFHSLDGSPIVLEGNSLHMNLRVITQSNIDDGVGLVLGTTLNELGFNGWPIVHRMQATDASDGVQTADAPNYTISWTSDPSTPTNGLDLTITVK